LYTTREEDEQLNTMQAELWNGNDKCPVNQQAMACSLVIWGGSPLTATQLDEQTRTEAYGHKGLGIINIDVAAFCRIMINGERDRGCWDEANDNQQWINRPKLREAMRELNLEWHGAWTGAIHGPLPTDRIIQGDFGTIPDMEEMVLHRCKLVTLAMKTTLDDTTTSRFRLLLGQIEPAENGFACIGGVVDSSDDE
jgi:hypothetical protein